MDSSFLLLPETGHVASRRSPSLRGALPGSDDTPGMTVRRYGARQRVFSAGDAARFIYEVAQGCVLVSRYLDDGRRQILDIVGPGRLFGFSGHLHRCTAEAVIPSMVCSLDRASARRSPVVSLRVEAAMERELDHLRDIAVLLGRKTAMERVSTLLVFLLETQPAGERTARLPISRTEMADYLGLTIETVSRTLTRLRQALLIDLQDAETVTVRDPVGLSAMADGASDCAA